MKTPEEIKLKLFCSALISSLHLKPFPAEPMEGVKERKDIEYTNRCGEKLYMDICEPAEKAPIAGWPVVINVHGGGLIGGGKEFSTGFCRKLAKKGYAVYSIEYRLVPFVRVFEQLDDVLAGMDRVYEHIRTTAFSGIYLTGESAGAFLALYAAAITRSEAMQRAMGYTPKIPGFSAMALPSGMFYTKRRDKVGLSLCYHFYRRADRNKEMAEYMDPEHPEVTGNIPPVYLTTSKADMMENYTLDYARALERCKVRHRLHHFGSDKRLVHAFPVLLPDYPESDAAIDEIDEWFRVNRDGSL